MLPESTLLQGGELFHLVEALRVRFACERSVRLCRGRLLANRFLLTLTKAALPVKPEATILELFSRIHMPVEFQDIARQNLADTQFVHFGFEEHETGCLYKVYLEFPFQIPTGDRISAGEGAEPGAVLLHLACKWDCADNNRYVVTKYWWHPSLATPAIVKRLATVYGDAVRPASFDIARKIVEFAGRSGSPLSYLEVREDRNQRRSFDLNLYDTQLQVQDVEPYLRRMVEHFEIPTEEWQPLYARIKRRRLGHLAGGIHRQGEDFFNLYYGVEWHDASNRPRPGRAGWAMKLVERFEHSTDQDQFYNYCWWPYLPVAPVENKYRPVNLLYQTFELAGLDERAFELVRRIQQEIGLFRTVWGVKWLPETAHPLEGQGDIKGRLAWEFYFYDYQRRDREVSITRVLKAIAPLIRCEVPVNESLPYFMFSLDVNGPLLSGERDLDVVHMYIGNPGSRVSSGISYGLTAERTALENFYFFFDAKRDLRQVAEKIYCSAHVDAARVDIDRILRPELRDCHTICVANKQSNDTAYFSGVNVDQLLVFLKMLRYPAAILHFAEANRGKLDHLLYDVGFDYVAKGDEVVVLKSGYYGVF